MLKFLASAIKKKKINEKCNLERRKLSLFADVILICAKSYKVLGEIMEDSKLTGKYIEYIVCL